MINYKDVYTVKKITKTVSVNEFFDKYVDLDFTISLCKECPQYNNNWACPEFKEDVLEYWRKYDKIELIALKLIFDENFRKEKHTKEETFDIINKTLFKERNNILPQLISKEKKVNGLCLSAGFCGICSECSRINKEECRYPDKVRYSIESIGTCVNETLKGVFNFNLEMIDMENGIFPEYLTLLTAILY